MYGILLNLLSIEIIIHAETLLKIQIVSLQTFDVKNTVFSFNFVEEEAI